MVEKVECAVVLDSFGCNEMRPTSVASTCLAPPATTAPIRVHTPIFDCCCLVDHPRRHFSQSVSLRTAIQDAVFLLLVHLSVTLLHHPPLHAARALLPPLHPKCDHPPKSKPHPQEADRHFCSGDCGWEGCRCGRCKDEVGKDRRGIGGGRRGEEGAARGQG